MEKKLIYKHVRLDIAKHETHRIDEMVARKQDNGWTYRPHLTKVIQDNQYQMKLLLIFTR